MSRPTSKERTLRCPTCAAEPGQPCIMVNLRYIKTGYHAARFHLMRKLEEEEFQRQYGQGDSTQARRT
jgi:hypothetical protein